MTAFNLNKRPDMTLTDIEQYANRTIEAVFVPQIYAYPLDDIPTELVPVHFDATEAVLSLDRARINLLVNFALPDDEIDELVPVPIREDHGGAFRVEIGQAVADFFGVDVQGSEQPVTEGMLCAAREAHRIGEKKSYRVLVERTTTQQVWIDVQATSREQARSSAIDAAGDVDFNLHGHTTEPVYASAEVMEKPQQAHRDLPGQARPRP